jgi:hypothetical protein
MCIEVIFLMFEICKHQITIICNEWENSYLNGMCLGVFSTQKIRIIKQTIIKMEYNISWGLVDIGVK